MSKSRNAKLALALIPTAVTGLVAGPASASADPFRTYIVRGITLADTSEGTALLASSDSIGGTTFSIDTPGTYTWSDYFTTYAPTSHRSIYLDAGDYSWGCEIIGTGVSGTKGDNYELTCWMNDLSKPSNPTASLPSGTAMWNVDLPANTYTWYTSLQNY
jgi:hypothetical protein